MSIRQSVNDFISYQSQVRQLADSTCKAYHRDLQQWLTWLDPAIADKEPGSVSEDDIRLFLIAENQRGLSAASLARIRASLNVFFCYLLDRSEVEKNPVQGVSTPKISRKLPEVLDVDTLQRLLDIKDNSPIALRDKAMLELFYSSGLRVAELSESNWHSLDHSQAIITVTGKGNKQRVVPVGSMALNALTDWKPHAKLWDKKQSGALFISTRGDRLKPRSIQVRIKYWAQQQGLWERVYPHLLRHSFASHMLESSNDLRAVQEMLGHANLSTTQIYTHLNFQHLAQVYDKAHPRARKK